MPDNSLQTINIENRILVIRGQQVMLDRDLAELYGVETKRLNEQVKRNIERFPEDFMFVLNKSEKEEVVANCDHHQVLKFSPTLPFAFTEQGVAMLSSILKSPKAVEVNIKIMRTFVAMRHFLQNNAQVFAELKAIRQHQIDTDLHLKESDRRIDELFDRMDKYAIDDTQGIFFQGQIFDAYAKFESFLQAATHDMVLIDNYVDLSVLERLTKKTTQCKRYNLHATKHTSYRPRHSDIQRPIPYPNPPTHDRNARPLFDNRQYHSLPYRRITQRFRKEVFYF